MPTPRPNESKDEFLARCIPEVINEGKETEQAIAICNSLFEEKRMDDPEENSKKLIEDAISGKASHPSSVALSSSGTCPSSYPVKRGSRCFRS